MTFDELARKYECAARTNAVIRKACSVFLLPSVEDFLASDKTIDWLIRVMKHFGEISSTELSDLLSQYQSDHDNSIQSNKQKKQSEAERETTFLELTQRFACSVRTKNVICRASGCHLPTVEEFLASGDSTKDLVRPFRNAGDKVASEVSLLIDLYLLESKDSSARDEPAYQEKIIDYEITFLELIERYECSVRTANAIRNASCRLPSVGEFLDSHNTTEDLVRPIRNAGKKVAREISKLLALYQDDKHSFKRVTGKLDRKEYQIEVEKFSIREILEHPCFPKRIYRRIMKNGLPEEILDKVLNTPLNSEIKEIANLLLLGSQKQAELLSILQLVKVSGLDALAKTSYKHQVDLHRRGLLKDYLEKVLPANEFTVLLGRSVGNTLSEVGEELHVSRERVRQLEVKVHRKLDCLLYGFENSIGDLLESIVVAGDGAAPLDQVQERLQLSLFELQFLLVRFRRSGKYNFIVAFDLVMTNDVKEMLPVWCDDVKKSVIAGLDMSSVEAIGALHPQIPKWAMNHLIQTDSITSTMTRGEKLLHILNRSKRPLGTNEIAHAFIVFFGDEHTPSTITNLAIENRSIALAGRGTYSTYTKLGLNDNDSLERVRTMVLKFLQEAESTISTEHIYSVLRADHQLPTQITNHYVLHSILRDDNRFRVFPGLTVQASDQNPDQHRTLDERIFSIVKEFGPLTVTEVYEKLKETGRYTLAVNVFYRLSQSKIYVKIDDLNYDVTERAFGDTVELQHVETACKICLAECPKTAERISEEILNIPGLSSMNSKPVLLWSLLSNFDGVETDGSLFRLDEDKIENRPYIEYYHADGNVSNDLREAFSSLDWRQYGSLDNNSIESIKLNMINRLLNGW